MRRAVREASAQEVARGTGTDGPRPAKEDQGLGGCALPLGQMGLATGDRQVLRTPPGLHVGASLDLLARACPVGRLCSLSFSNPAAPWSCSPKPTPLCPGGFLQISHP